MVKLTRARGLRYGGGQRGATTCIGCGQPIVWGKTLAGHWTPNNPDGSTHWATCRAREFFEARRLRSGGGEGVQLDLMELEVRS